jgi:hypothetical protein
VFHVKHGGVLGRGLGSAGRGRNEALQQVVAEHAQNGIDVTVVQFSRQVIKKNDRVDPRLDMHQIIELGKPQNEVDQLHLPRRKALQAKLVIDPDQQIGSVRTPGSVSKTAIPVLDRAPVIRQLIAIAPTFVQGQRNDKVEPKALGQLVHSRL